MTLSPEPLLLRLRERLRDYRPAVDVTKVDAAVLVAITDAPEPDVILTRRASHMNSHAGEVAFPGGKRDADDSSLAATALREAYEEIGLVTEQVELIGELDVFVSRIGLQVQPIVALVPHHVVLIPNPEEIESIFRVPLRFLLEAEPSYTHRIRFMGQDVIVPSFNVDDYVIWGLTAFMLVDLLQRVYDREIVFQMPTRPAS